jgi:pimeloyl-ACP methyl ester carboxylesterase
MQVYISVIGSQVGAFMSAVLRVILIGLGTFAVLLVSASILALGYRAWRQYETSRAMAIESPNGIVQTGFVRIGGIDQWISIRGQNRDNPVILLLHGGPGLAMSPLQVWFVPWEHAFTVVQWDQRGAGLTYGRYGKATPNLTEKQIVSDGIELAEYLRVRLHKEKIVLLGHSWGSMIGLEMIARRPELFSAFVGTGQIVDAAAGERLTYDRLLQKADMAGDMKTVDALKAIGPPPYKSVGAMMSERGLAGAYPVPNERGYVAKSAPAALFAPGITLIDIFDNVAGALYSTDRLYLATSSFKAERLGTKFEVPIFFFQGELDDNTPTDLVAAYLESIDAPHKELVRFPGGGHLTLLTMRDQFLKELIARVRPLVVASPPH